MIRLALTVLVLIAAGAAFGMWHPTIQVDNPRNGPPFVMPLPH